MTDRIINNTEILPEDLKFISDLKIIIYTVKTKAYQAVDLYNVACNWLVGRCIVMQEQKGRERAEYGKRIIELASKALTEEFGKGYGLTQIKNFKKFYLLFHDLDIRQTIGTQKTVMGKTSSDLSVFTVTKKAQTLSDLCRIGYSLPTLSWSHYERLLRVDDRHTRD